MAYEQKFIARWLQEVAHQEQRAAQMTRHRPDEYAATLAECLCGQWLFFAYNAPIGSTDDLRSMVDAFVRRPEQESELAKLRQENETLRLELGRALGSKK